MTNVVDPDPYVFGPPGSGSFHHQEKKSKKKTYVNVSSKSNKQKNLEKNAFCWHLVSHWRKKQDLDP